MVICPVGLPLSRGSSNRVRSSSRGGRSPLAPSKAGAVNGAILVNGDMGTNGTTPDQDRRNRSVTKVGIKLGAYDQVTVASTLCVL